MNVPGSPSSELQTTYFVAGVTACGMKLHLSPVGKPAPPRPRSADVLHLGDDLLGRHLLDEDLAQRLVAAARLVVLQAPVEPVEALHEDRVGTVDVGGERRHGQAHQSRLLRAAASSLSGVIAHSICLLLCRKHRRIAARAHALAFLQREAAVGRGLVEADAELLLQVLARLVRALQRARQVGAERELVAADRLQVVHRVERRDFVHRDRRHAEVVRDEVHRLGRQPAVLVLRDGERRHHRRLLLVGRILRDRRVDLRERIGREHASARSSVDLSEHDVLRADDRDHVGDHVAARHLVERREVREARRADLEAVRLVGAVGDEVDAELALRVLDRGVGLARAARACLR